MTARRRRLGDRRAGASQVLGGAANSRARGRRHLLVETLQRAHRHDRAQHEAERERDVPGEQGQEAEDDDAVHPPVALRVGVGAVAPRQPVDACDDTQADRERQDETHEQASDDVSHENHSRVTETTVVCCAVPTQNYTPLFLL